MKKLTVTSEGNNYTAIDLGEFEMKSLDNFIVFDGFRTRCEIPWGPGEQN